MITFSPEDALRLLGIGLIAVLVVVGIVVFMYWLKGKATE